MLAEARGFALLTRRVRKDHQELRHLRRPSRHLVRDKAEGKINLTPRDHTRKAYKHWMTRVAQKRQTAFRMHPSWQGRAVHEAPLERRLDEAQEFLDTKKNAMSTAVVAGRHAVCAHRGSKSAKSARILSPLPSSVHDSTDPSSGWRSTKLYSFFAR